jgi:hypothetical protein
VDKSNEVTGDPETNPLIEFVKALARRQARIDAHEEMKDLAVGEDKKLPTDTTSKG